MKGQTINLIEENGIYHLYDIGVRKDTPSKYKKQNKKTLNYGEFNYNSKIKDFSQTKDNINKGQKDDNSPMFIMCQKPFILSCSLCC